MLIAVSLCFSFPLSLVLRLYIFLDIKIKNIDAETAGRTRYHMTSRPRKKNNHQQLFDFLRLRLQPSTSHETRQTKKKNSPAPQLPFHPLFVEIYHSIAFIMFAARRTATLFQRRAFSATASQVSDSDPNTSGGSFGPAGGSIPSSQDPWLI